MKKLTLFLAFILTFTLTACDKKEASKGKKVSSEKIVVGASLTPHKEIIDYLQPEFKKEGLDVKTIVFDDYIQPNLQLESKDLDLNYFQHKPYLDEYNIKHKTNIVSLGNVHLEPIGFYSKKFKNIKDLPKNGEIIIPNDAVNGKRALILFEKNNIIKLKNTDSNSLTEKDIIENPKNLHFTPMDAQNIANAYVDADGAVINSNFALISKLNPLKDALVLEDKDSPYANIIAVLNENKDKEKYKKFMKILHSEKCRKFIKDKYKGAIIPAF